jgi:hypothetical protein
MEKLVYHPKAALLMQMADPYILIADDDPEGF